MFRIAFAKMLVLLRLAIVASLVVYMLPNATFAMHGDDAPSVTASFDDGQAEHASMDDPGYHDHGLSKDMAKKDQKPNTQNCCSDFCISLAMMSGAPEFGSPRSDSVRDFLNDSSVFGQLQSLHRPPSIRA